MMPDFLAQVALGPVQGFIAAARVMRDFAFGSQLLSYLANKTADYLKAPGRGAQLIFPAQVGAINSNKIMVIFHDHTAQDVRQKLIDTEQLVRAELHDMAESFFSTFAPDQLESHDVAVWQVTDVLEYYWGMCEVTDAGYASAVQTLDRLLAARKMTRNFVPNQHASNRFKSSLTGTYESVIPDSRYVNTHDSSDMRQQKLQALRTVYGIHGAEYLSGVDLFKRRYQIPHVSLDFVSPRAMAARSIVVGMNATKFASFDQEWQKFAHKSFWDATPDEQAELVLDEDADRFDLQNWFANNADTLDVSDDFDDEWREFDAKVRNVDITLGQPFRQSTVKVAIFDGGLKYLLEEMSREGDFATLKDDITTLRELFEIQLPPLPQRGTMRSILKAGERSSTPYYAMLKADGDNMGKYVSELAIQGIAAHQNFSNQVAQFAAGVPAIAAQYHGFCVYVGGDDLLVMVPLRNAIACAQKLQSDFSNALAEIHTQHPTLPPPALSIGCVMAHHDEAIDDVVKILNETAHYAKKRKSALAICVAKRSGSTLTVAGKWGQFDVQMQEIMEMSVERKIPHGYAYELRELLMRMDNTSLPYLDNVMASDAKRILARKKQSENQRVDVDRITRLINAVAVYGDRIGFYGQLDQWVSQVIVAQNLSV
jgi:hypothetical protein